MQKRLFQSGSFLLLCGPGVRSVTTWRAGAWEASVWTLCLPPGMPSGLWERVSLFPYWIIQPYPLLGRFLFMVCEIVLCMFSIYSVWKQQHLFLLRKAFVPWNLIFRSVLLGGRPPQGYASCVKEEQIRPEWMDCGQMLRLHSSLPAEQPYPCKAEGWINTDSPGNFAKRNKLWIVWRPPFQGLGRWPACHTSPLCFHTVELCSELYFGNSLGGNQRPFVPGLLWMLWACSHGWHALTQNISETQWPWTWVGSLNICLDEFTYFLSFAVIFFSPFASSIYDLYLSYRLKEIGLLRNLHWRR